MRRGLLILLVAVAGCVRLPEGARPHSSALADTADTHLGRALAPAVAANRGKTGIYALRDGRDAFAARVLLAASAERSLDVQYYIWHADVTGGLLAEALWDAAERGVRVRMLLDDNNTRGLDDALAVLDAHPNIEVRLYNPYASRGFRLGELLTDFPRLNRRMHNKSFTADNQASIVGGRNVGDEYFGGESLVEFADLDVVAVGSAVSAVSASFDAYWNSPSAYPAASLLRRTPGQAEQVRAAWQKLHSDPQAARYLQALAATPLVRELLAGTLSLDWAAARIVADDPAKTLSPPERDELHLVPRLTAALGEPARELDIVSPYFVPGDEGTALLTKLAGRGVKVRVLTNSLAATDVTAVHAGYSKYREALLRAGVRLYELKRSGHVEAAERSGHGGSSGASLHAKTFAVDRARVFVGSFNFDPRSARLNTEMGIVMESPRFAARLSEVLDAELPRGAYEVRLAGGSLEWRDGDTRLTAEPGTGWARRAWVGFLSLLPIEWLL